MSKLSGSWILTQRFSMKKKKEEGKPTHKGANVYAFELYSSIWRIVSPACYTRCKEWFFGGLFIERSVFGCVVFLRIISIET